MTIGPEQVVTEQRREQRRNGVIWLAVALILAMVLGFAYRTDKRADDSDQQLSASGQQVETLKGQVQANGQIAQSAKDAADEANRRLIAAGKPTVPVPTVSPITPEPPSPSSVTLADVRAVVVTELAQHKATISQTEITQIARVAATLVPKPVDGKTPTPAQLQPIVTATVAAYCVGDKCVGKPGDKGDKGDVGAKGDPAPKVTDGDLLAAAKTALAAYCAADSQPCRGPQGEPGSSVTGPPGEQGRSVVDMDCMDDGRWRITYDKPFPDGETVRYSRGPCRVVVIPTAPSTEAKSGR